MKWDVNRSNSTERKRPPLSFQFQSWKTSSGHNNMVTLISSSNLWCDRLFLVVDRRGSDQTTRNTSIHDADNWTNYWTHSRMCFGTWREKCRLDWYNTVQLDHTHTGQNHQNQSGTSLPRSLATERRRSRRTVGYSTQIRLKVENIFHHIKTTGDDGNSKAELLAISFHWGRRRRHTTGVCFTRQEHAKNTPWQPEPRTDWAPNSDGGRS